MNKKIVCHICDHVFSRKCAWRVHMRHVHEKIKEKSCPKCNKKFARNYHLQRHYATVHNKTKKYSCPKCKYKCLNKYHYLRHIKMVHDKIKDFSCPTCDYKCSTKYMLKSHKRVCTSGITCSSGEYKIMKVLNKMKYPYQHNTSYQLKASSWLRWDFILQTDDEPLFIEYDGRQHFEPVRFGGISETRAKENLKKTQEMDLLKNNFCLENGYLLLRIPYTEQANITTLVTNFIKVNTTWS